MEKILNLFKNKKYVYIAIGVVFVIGGVFVFNNKQATNDTIMISHTDFTNEVSISGKVVASEEVNLGFKNEGKIERIFSEVGQNVKTGDYIVKIDAKDAEKSVHDAEVSLESARLALDKLKLQNSNDNLNANLIKAYDDGFTEVSDAFLDLSTSINGLEDILAEDIVSDNIARMSGTFAVNYKREAESLFNKASDAFRKNLSEFRLSDRNSTNQNIEAIINETYNTTKIFTDAIKSTKNLVDYLADDTGNASNYSSAKSTLSEYTDLINGHLANLLSVKTNIKNYKDAFSDAGLDTQDALLSIKQKENALQDARNKLSDYYIRAPFDGLITTMDAKLGEIAGPNTSLVTIMSADTFQIESYVPEVSIALIKLGDAAKVTLDAYGDDVLFYANVVSIDPAETIRDGVSTYKIKLQFGGKDDRIKSGMTANVAIATFSKQNVIVLPGGVVINKDGKKFVQIKVGDKITDREIQIGSVSSLGQVEIISGLKDGDQVVLNPKAQ
jgi:multidrug efflux pump subunit AcrA (membrane-fusion protein)